MIINQDQDFICGINASIQIINIRPKSVEKLFIDKTKKTNRLKDLEKLAESNRIEVVFEEPKFYENLFEDQNHQGVAIICNKRLEENEDYLDLLLKRENVLILILDHLTDPHNVGACLRSAAAAGADAVIVPKNRSCHLTPTVRKISSGGSELLPFIVVTNIVRAIKKLSESGVKVVGAAAEANLNYSDVNLKGNIALVIGSEDKGIKRLTSKNCDELVSINMPGNIESLNASVSSGILLFEYVRQNTVSTV
jgi:23S rRNA (guanosine2251-2'-O)-methyltransferase|tara:strand:+ start:4048 stop:4803 length:756 start_codon:yes stop_codon:yes gene_type:complete